MGLKMVFERGVADSIHNFDFFLFKTEKYIIR